MKMDPSLHLVSDQTSAEVRGRTAEFEELVHAEHVRLFRALALITRDPAEAEDVMQEAFLRVWSAGVEHRPWPIRLGTCTGPP